MLLVPLGLVQVEQQVQQALQVLVPLEPQVQLEQQVLVPQVPLELLLPLVPVLRMYYLLAQLLLEKLPPMMRLPTKSSFGMTAQVNSPTWSKAPALLLMALHFIQMMS